MNRERFGESWGRRVRSAGKGRVIVGQGAGEIVLEEGTVPRKEYDPSGDIASLEYLVGQAFPDHGWYMGQAEYFVPTEIGSEEGKISTCARLAQKGWSSRKVAERIIDKNIRERISLGLGIIDKDDVADDIATLAHFLAQFYPGNQTKERRKKRR